MNSILFEDIAREHLLPFTYTRPISEIRIGLTTISEKWNHFLNTEVSYLTEKYLSQKYKSVLSEVNLMINGGVVPDDDLIDAIKKLKPGEQLIQGHKLIAAYLSSDELNNGVKPLISNNLKSVEYGKGLLCIENLWDIFLYNDQVLRQDFNELTKGRKSAPIPDSNKVIRPENVFLESGAIVSCSIINASTGPVYIGKDAEIMEGCMIRGPFAIGEHAVLKMGTKIYGATTIGPHSKVGGEVNNSVIFGYSNKAHDGFLGNSVIGEWCNLGADTNNSNLKNNYGNVKVWNCYTNQYIDSKLQFCGLFMGDHSKSGINTMFNTGTVVGVSSNVFGAGFPPKFIPSFSWGGHASLESFHLDKAIELASEVFKRRGLTLNETEIGIMDYLFNNRPGYIIKDLNA